jgi:2-haloacid dehalogenase
LSHSAALPILAFDVFGTVVDWFSTIRNEAAMLFADYGCGADPAAFALAWRAGYQPAMQRVRSGELGWTRIDDLHRLILDQILIDFNLAQVDESRRRELNLVWHRLDPWPDVVDGLSLLKTRFRVCTLSNGNLSLLSDLARHGGLQWDLILSAETFRAYKPDPASYLGVAQVFDVAPHTVTLVAAHKSDLAAARACGLRTAFIERPLECGPGTAVDISADHSFDWHAKDLIDLARQMAA